MAAIKFDGCDYPVPDEFTNRELIQIEDLSGHKWGEPGGIAWGTLLAMLVVSAARVGTVITYEALLDLPQSAIEWKLNDEVADGPPAEEAAEVEPAVALVPKAPTPEATGPSTSDPPMASSLGK